MPEESFAGAIQRASRAVANAEEAFHSRGSHAENFIDLTRTPSNELSEVPGTSRSQVNGEAEADYISTTTHPHDVPRHSRTQRLSTSLNQPVYGSGPAAAPPQLPLPWIQEPRPDPDDSLARVRAQRDRAQRAHIFQAHARGLFGNFQQFSSERDERAAIRRQRENHDAWLRTQARTRQLQEELQHQVEQDTILSSSQSPSPEPENTLSSGPGSPDTPPSLKPEMKATGLEATEIEAIDLTAVDDMVGLNDVIAKQRADAIASQRPAGATESGRTTFSAFKCPICMDILGRATVTKCGHIFCHKCIIDTLKWSADQHRQEHPNHKIHPGSCPVCRQALQIKDVKGTGRTLVPLRMKKFSLKRKRNDKGKGRADEIEVQGSRPPKKRQVAKGKGKRSATTPAPKREGTDDLFGEFTNEDYASGLVQ